MKRIFLFTLLFVIGCGPSSLRDFHHEGEACCRDLVLELQQIHNRERLLRAENVLKKHFEKLVDLMIKARKFQLKHPDDVFPDVPECPCVESKFGSDCGSVSAVLKEELRRIYEIEGGRETIERAQHEALVRLYSARSRNWNSDK